MVDVEHESIEVIRATQVLLSSIAATIDGVQRGAERILVGHFIGGRHRYQVAYVFWNLLNIGLLQEKKSRVRNLSWSQ